MSKVEREKDDDPNVTAHKCGNGPRAGEEYIESIDQAKERESNNAKVRGPRLQPRGV